MISYSIAAARFGVHLVDEQDTDCDNIQLIQSIQDGHASPIVVQLSLPSATSKHVMRDLQHHACLIMQAS
jgi:hypothetical protein